MEANYKKGVFRVYFTTIISRINWLIMIIIRYAPKIIIVATTFQVGDFLSGRLASWYCTVHAIFLRLITPCRLAQCAKKSCQLSFSTFSFSRIVIGAKAWRLKGQSRGTLRNGWEDGKGPSHKSQSMPSAKRCQAKLVKKNTKHLSLTELPTNNIRA